MRQVSKCHPELNASAPNGIFPPLPIHRAPPPPRLAPPPASPPAVLTNGDHVRHILSLSRCLHRDVPVRVTIQPPAPLPGALAQLSIHAISQTAYNALPVATAPYADWAESLYRSPDACHQLWVSLYHLLAERGETRLLGSFHHSQPLPARASAFLSAFSSAQPVYLYLSCLYVADELPPLNTPPPPPGSFPAALASALAALRGAADAAGRARAAACSAPHDAAPPVPIPSPPAVPRVLVADARPGRAVITAISATATTNQPHPDVFMWDLPPSVLARRGAPPARVAATRIRAGIAWLAVWARARAALTALDIAEHDSLRVVADWFGSDVAASLAAMGDGPPQHGVKSLSYSSFKETDVHVKEYHADGDENNYMIGRDDQNRPTEKMMLPISARLLRDVGRLGFEDNIVTPPPFSDTDSLVVVNDGNGRMVTRPIGDGTLVKVGLIPDDVLIY